jgi:hypothetical protein
MKQAGDCGLGGGEMASIQMEHGIGRAKNAIQEYLVHKLLFPKVYLDAEFNGKAVDVLAIDREGTGDVHAVYLVYQGTDTLNALENSLANIAANIGVPPAKIVPHFIYAAIVNNGPGSSKYVPSDQIIQNSFADDGVGRLGILYVDLCEDDPKFQVRVILKAERFRSSKEIVELSDRFVAENTANWEYRE